VTARRDRKLLKINQMGILTYSVFVTNTIDPHRDHWIAADLLQHPEGKARLQSESSNLGQ